MKPKVLCLLLAIHSVLSAKNGAQNKSDALSTFLAQAKHSGSFFDAKLQSNIESYRRKIVSRQNERKQLMKKILDRMPQECRKINCPFEEKPVCAKFFYKNKNSAPFYVRMLNECEMRYMKCHRGLEATIVSMENCHSIMDDIMQPEQTGKRRPKRSVETGQPLKAVSSVKPGNLNVIVNNTSFTNNNTNRPFGSTNHKTNTHNKQTIKPIITAELKNVYEPITISNDTFIKKDNITPKDVGRVAIKKHELKNKLKVGRQTFINPKSLNVNKTAKKKNMRTRAVQRDGKQYLKKNLGKNRMFTEEVFSNVQKAGLGNQPSITGDTVIEQNEVNQIGKGDTSIEFTIEMDDAEVEKALGINMHNISSDKDPDNEPVKNIDENELKPSGNGDPSIEITIEMDDADVEKALGINVKNKPSNNVAIPHHNNDPVNNIKTPGTQGDDSLVEVTVEIDDKDLDNEPVKNIHENELKPSGNGDPSIEITIEMDDADVEEALGMNVKNKPSNNVAIPHHNNDPVNNIKTPDTQGDDSLIEISIEVDDKDLDNIFPNVEPKTKSPNDEQGNTKDNFKQNLHRKEAVIELKSEELLTFQNGSPPLVDEPTADEDDGFNSEEEYRYEPKKIPPIISLDVNDDKKDETENFNKDDGKPAHIPSEASGSDEKIGSDVIDNVTDGNLDDGGNNNSDLNPIGNDNGGETPSSKQNDYEKGDDEEYQAECPQRCPISDMMVCAVCHHGIYRTFLSVCHMRMYQCKRVHDEQLQLVSRLPCVMSAPLITDDPAMQPQGRISEPGDQDTVLRYVRCREKEILGKSPRCTFDNAQQLNAEVIEKDTTEVGPMNYY